MFDDTGKCAGSVSYASGGALASRQATHDAPPPIGAYARYEGFGLKRLFDVTIVLLTLPATALVMSVAALLIWLQDRGPVLFVQERVGRFGRIFRMYKLRTMTLNSGGPAFTSPQDARITRIGAVLRRYRIDELPQVFNVLFGEMSLCGPRPEVAELVSEYEKHIPRYQFRHDLLPGMTGLAQVTQGYAAGVDSCAEKLRIDLAYAREARLLYDMRLLAKTVYVLVFGFGWR